MCSFWNFRIFWIRRVDSSWNYLILTRFLVDLRLNTLGKLGVISPLFVLYPLWESLAGWLMSMEKGITTKSFLELVQVIFEIFKPGKQKEGNFRIIEIIHKIISVSLIKFSKIYKEKGKKRSEIKIVCEKTFYLQSSHAIQAYENWLIRYDDDW